MKRLIGALPLLLCLPGCAASGIGGPAANCREAQLVRFIGQKVDQDIGHKLLLSSSARVMRWAPPGAALTSDFRPDRLTVAYDADMTITSARCG